MTSTRRRTRLLPVTGLFGKRPRSASVEAEKRPEAVPCATMTADVKERPSSSVDHQVPRPLERSPVPSAHRNNGNRDFFVRASPSPSSLPRLPARRALTSRLNPTPPHAD
eukprot:7045305-Prymnesium_polylepis.1